MKVSHELPLGLMHHAYEWNNYDYCLPHLIDQYDQYRLFFQKSRLDKRFIIMDNGLFEGVTHTTEDLLNKINLVRPDVFIVPDAWNDSNTTLVNAKSWMINYKQHLPEGVNLMAVCQGQDIGELITTYQTLVDLGYTHIAFNHSSCAYQEMYPTFSGTEPLKASMYGRMEFIRKLVERNIIRPTYYHHLLGCSLPQEFMAYKDWKFIKSVDTSNPILVGAEGERYSDSGISWKPKNKLEHYFEMDLSDRLDDIIFNVNKFKSYVK
jgi:type VI protein secretion system component Hcp